MKDEDLEELVRIALLDLATLNEWSIQINPERVERPRLAIEALKERIARLEIGVQVRDQRFEHCKKVVKRLAENCEEYEAGSYDWDADDFIAWAEEQVRKEGESE